MEEEKNKGSLKKHIASIHCSNTQSLLQRKLSNSLLYNAFPKLMEEDEHIISIKALCDLIGYKGKNTKAIKEALKELISTVLEWNIIEEKTGEEDWTASSILASVNLKDGVCRYSYSKKLRELFHNPTMYGRINLNIQSRFASSYGLALYENCVRYKGLKYTKEFSFPTFRKIMGVPDDKYAAFNDFTKRVINIAVKEVNTNSDLFIEPEIKRVGRKPFSIKFKIKERAKKKKLGKKEDCLSQNEVITKEIVDFIDLLNDSYGINQLEAQKLIKKYGIEKVTEKTQLIESSHQYKTGQIKTLGGYLIKAIKDDYLPSKSSQDIISVEKLEKEKVAVAEQQREKEKEARERKIKGLYSEYLEREIGEILFNLSKAKQAEVYDGFEKKLITSRNTVILKRYRKSLLKSPMVKAIFHGFIFDNHSNFVQKLMNFDDFKQKYL